MKAAIQKNAVRLINATCRAVGIPQYSAIYVALVEVREESESFYTTPERLQEQLVSIHQEALHAIGPAGRNLPPAAKRAGLNWRERLRALLYGAAVAALALCSALAFAVTLSH